MRLFILLTCLILSTCIYSQTTFPFDKIEFREGYPYVLHKNQQLRLIRIDTCFTDMFLRQCKDDDPRKWQEDFIEKLPYFVEILQDSTVETVSAGLVQFGDTINIITSVSAEKMESAMANVSISIAHKRISRDHFIQKNKNLNYLSLRRFTSEISAENLLTVEQVTEDLEHLEWQIEHNYSYKDRTNFNYKEAIDYIIQSVGEGIHKKDFALQLKLLMANFGDGHSDVSFYKTIFDEKDKNGNLPCKILRQDGKFYAYYPSDTIQTSMYEILSIQAIPITEIYKLAESLASKTTTGFVENKALLYLSEIKVMLSCFDIQELSSVDVEMIIDGKKVVKKMDLAKYRHPSTLDRSMITTKKLEGNIGFITMRRFMSPQEDFIDELHSAMDSFKNTDGLIIDIRRNGGGTREPLLALLPYFIDSPKVCNLGRFRIDDSADFHPKYGYLEKRDMFYANYDGFTEEEVSAINQFNNAFTPTYNVADEEFTDWHYLVISPMDTGYYYDKPVIILTDAYCFSASDIFAAAMKEGDNVTLMGETTGGGSGFSQKILLLNAGIEMKLSTMVSYQPNGKLYEGNGVSPDVELQYTMEDKMGLTDSFLVKAKEYILGRE